MWTPICTFFSIGYKKQLFKQENNFLFYCSVNISFLSNEIETLYNYNKRKKRENNLPTLNIFYTIALGYVALFNPNIFLAVVKAAEIVSLAPCPMNSDLFKMS